MYKLDNVTYKLLPHYFGKYKKVVFFSTTFHNLFNNYFSTFTGILTDSDN